jgi:hypothetical protein
LPFPKADSFLGFYDRSIFLWFGCDAMRRRGGRYL